MPIVNSYQAAPTAVADFAQETGYLQEKARQIAAQKAYNNHLEEINLQYQNQSELSRQAAIQRAALTKQENDYKNEFAEKEYQRNLKAMAAQLEMRGDYQSRIMAEQFHNQADALLVREKTRKESSGWGYSPSAQRRQLEIKQQIQAIQADTSTAMRDKLPELRSLQRQLETMVPDQEPDNYVKPNTEIKDKDGKVWQVDSNGVQRIKTYADGSTESQHAAVQKAKEIDMRAANDMKKIITEINGKIKLEQIRLQNKPGENQVKRVQSKLKYTISNINKYGKDIAKYDTDIAKLQAESDSTIAKLQEAIDKINNTNYDEYENGESARSDDIGYYNQLKSKLDGIDRQLGVKQVKRNELVAKSAKENEQMNSLKKLDTLNRLSTGDRSALPEIENAAKRGEQWAIDILRSAVGQTGNIIAEKNSNNPA